MQFKQKLAQVALAACFVPMAATAGDMGTAYLQVGINGVGLGYAASVAPDFAVRGQYNTFKQSFSGDVGDFGTGSVLNIDLKLDSLQLLGDWYPSSGGMRVSGGLVFNNNKITIAGTGTVGSTPGATVNGEIKMSDGVAPYVGVGYSTRPKEAKGLGFIADFGLMFQNPKASLTAAGVPAADVEAQRVKMQDAIDKLKIMPVIAIGVSYSF